MRPSRFIRNTAISLSLGLLAAACDDPLDIEFDPADRSLAELHGRQIGAAQLGITAVPIMWFPNGEEIAYSAAAGKATRAINVTTAAERLLDSTSTGWLYNVVIAGPNQGYFTFHQSDSGSELRHFLGSASPFSFARVIGDAAVGPPVVVADEQSLAAFIISPDSLFVYDTQARTTIFGGTGCGRVMAISRDGSKVICRAAAFDTPSYIIQDVATRSSEPMPMPANFDNASARQFFAVRWLRSGIRVLHQQFGEFFISDVPATGRRLVADSLMWAFGSAQPVAWSKDGAQIAFVVPYCAKSLLFACDKLQSLLSVVDVSDGRARRVAVHNAGILSAAFSPDGNRLAYNSDGGLFVLQL